MSKFGVGIHALRALVMTMALAAAPWDARAEPGPLREIATGVWYRESDLAEDEWLCNNLVIEMQDYLIVIDSNMPRGALRLMEEIKRVSPKPVKYVFNTHSHADHLYANELWTAQGATTFAYVGVLKDLELNEPGRWQLVAKAREDVRALGTDHPQAPMQTFSTPVYVLEDATRRVEFHHLGWAHTRGDGFVVLPKEKIIVVGDAAANYKYINYFEMRDAYIRNWPKVLDRLARMNPRYVVPGHGALGGREVLIQNRDFFRALYAAVRSAIRKGKKLQDIVQWQGEKPVSTSIVLPPAMQARVEGQLLAQHVVDTYQEISQGKPVGDVQKKWTAYDQ